MSTKQLEWQSNWFILQTLKITITYKTLLINSNLHDLLIELHAISVNLIAITFTFRGTLLKH